MHIVSLHHRNKQCLCKVLLSVRLHGIEASAASGEYENASFLNSEREKEREILSEASLSLITGKGISTHLRPVRSNDS